MAPRGGLGVDPAWFVRVHVCAHARLVTLPVEDMSPTSPVLGGCLCGAVRYRYDGPVGPATYCHCSDCRRATGSAFNVGVRFEVEKFRVERGRRSEFDLNAKRGSDRIFS